MKKFIIILLFLVVLISVCGCVSCAEIGGKMLNIIYKEGDICLRKTRNKTRALNKQVCPCSGGEEPTE